MKSKSIYTYVPLIMVVVFASAFLYDARRLYISPSQAFNDIQVQLNWIAYDTDHVAVEYDVLGVIQTAFGNYTDCPVGGSLVANAAGQDIAGKVYTSCRLVSDGKYAVTQFFYNNFRSNPPVKVIIQIGDLSFFSPGKGQEVYIPLLKEYIFDLPAEPVSDITAFPEGMAQAASGIDLSVSRVDFTPNIVKVDSCLTLPDNGDWGIDAHLVMGNQVVRPDFWEIPNFRDPKTFESSKRCYTTFTSNAPDFRSIKSGDISFVVEKVYRNMPDCVDSAGFEKIKDELAKYGIAPQPDPSGTYCFAGDIVNNASPDVNAYLFTYIEDQLREEVAGPLEVVIK